MTSQSPDPESHSRNIYDSEDLRARDDDDMDFAAATESSDDNEFYDMNEDDESGNSRICPKARRPFLMSGNMEENAQRGCHY